MKPIILAAALLTCTITLAEDPPLPLYPVQVSRVIDGDTIKATIQLGFSITIANRSIRLQGFDAWETSKRRKTVNVTDEELAKGKLASKALKELLDEHTGRIYLKPAKKSESVYGRLAGYLHIYPEMGDPIDIAEFMTANGFTRNPE